MRIACLLAVVLAAAVAAGCGGADDESAAPAPPATLAPNALAGLESRARALDAAALAQDAFEPEQLAAVLADGGFLAGAEREFYGRAEPFDHVVARALRFGSVGGAEAYLGWLERHADDVLGRAEPEPSLALGESEVTFSLLACGQCKKELPTYLVAWRRDDTVLWLLAAGRGADRGEVAALGRELDGALG